jgi:hypothetical protein
LLGEREAVTKYTSNVSDIQRFYLKRQNDPEVNGEHHVKISDRFTASENLDDNVDMNRAWENVKVDIKFVQGELTQHKPWFAEVFKIIRKDAG